MTPTQLRAFAAVVRRGSVKEAAIELNVTEAAVSLNIGQLRKELGDQLFRRTASGLAFTPGGLRLASRAAQLLGLQDRTVLEVHQAGSGRRMLRLATSSLFGEYAAPGLIEQFSGRAKDLDVELSLHDPREFAGLLLSRSIDAAIGPLPPLQDESVSWRPFLAYRLIAVGRPEHPFADHRPSVEELRSQNWFLGPSAAHDLGLTPRVVRSVGIPEDKQVIFQSHAAAVEEARRSNGIALVVDFAVGKDIAAKELIRIDGPGLPGEGMWNVLTLAGPTASPTANELVRFVQTPRAVQAMIKPAGSTPGRFKPSIYITLWS